MRLMNCYKLRVDQVIVKNAFKVLFISLALHVSALETENVYLSLNMKMTSLI